MTTDCSEFFASAVGAAAAGAAIPNLRSPRTRTFRGPQANGTGAGGGRIIPPGGNRRNLRAVHPPVHCVRYASVPGAEIAASGRYKPLASRAESSLKENFI